MEITKREWALAGIFGLLWFIFSSKSWLLFLNNLSPTKGFLIYYVIVFIAIFILSKLGLVIFNVKIKNWQQVIGTALIFFSFFAIFNFTNPYVQYVTQNATQGCSNIFFQSEDGVLFSWIYGLNQNMFLSRILVGIAIFVLVLIASLLIERKVKLEP